VGVSYVSIFIVCYHITFWVFGGAHSISWDYRPGVPQKEEAERRVPWSQKPIGGWIHRIILRRQVEDIWKKKTDEVPVQDVEKALSTATMDASTPFPGSVTVASPAIQTEITEVSRQVSRLSRSSHKSEKIQPQEPAPEVPLHTSALHMALVQRVLRPLRAAANSITITLVASLIISVVTDLKALFVDVSEQGGPTWHGPDGRPPLAFMIDTGTYSLPLPLSCT
jgi:auxin efflux carrier family protein